MDWLTPGTGMGGAALVAFVLQALWQAREKKRDDAENKVTQTIESERVELKALLKETRDSQSRMELEFRDMVNKVNQTVGTIAQIDQRVNGISNDYGQRIKDLELWRARIEAQQSTSFKRRGNKP